MYKRFSVILLFIVCTVLSQAEHTTNLVNWAGNQVCKVKAILYPKSKEELIHLVKEATRAKHKLKAVGSAHSWNDTICSSGKLLDIKYLNKVLNIDKENMLVEVEAGITLKKLNKALAQEGLALSNQTAINAQTLAGVVATATHGTGHTGTFSSFVKQLELVAGNGKVYSLDMENDLETFSAARVNLGALGVIYSLVLSCEPQFALEHKTKKMTRQKLIKNYKALYNKNDFLNFSWNAFTDQVSVNCYKKRSLLAIGSKKNIAVSYKALTSDKSGNKRLEEEIGINARYLTDVFVPLKKLFQEYKKRGYDLTGRVFFRFVKADRHAYLSTAGDRDTVYISISTPVDKKYALFYRAFEDAMMAYQGRPHWGKINFLTYPKAHSIYGEKLDKFIAVMHRLDPDHVFSNAFTQRVLSKSSTGETKAN